MLAQQGIDSQTATWDSFLSADFLIAQYQELRERPLPDAQSLIKFLADWAQVQYGIDEALSILSFNYAVDVGNADNKALVERAEETVKPIASVQDELLRVKFLSSPFAENLPNEDYGLLLRRYKEEGSIFHADNIQLEIRESAFSRSYFERAGETIVAYRGKDYPLENLAPLINTHERNTREEIWRAVMTARAQIATPNQQTLDELVTTRNILAKNVGFPDAEGYYFKKRQRDYSPEELEQLCQTIEEKVTPYVAEIYEEHRRKLGVEKLRPWDIGVGRIFEIQVTPYSNTATHTEFAGNALLENTKQILARLNPEFASRFQTMCDLHEIDHEARTGKTQGAAQYSLLWSQRSRIFMSATGIPEDLMTLLHETGHALHGQLSQAGAVAKYNFVEGVLEIAELASMALEALGTTKLEEVLPAETAALVKRTYFANALSFLPYCMQVISFQSWFYKNPEATHEERNAHWIELDKRFGPDLDWTGLEEYRGIYWQQQHHIFAYPFYYSEYAIAQLGALLVMNAYLEKPESCMEGFTSALKLRASKTIQETYTMAGAAFPFDKALVEKAAALSIEQWRGTF